MTAEQRTVDSTLGCSAQQLVKSDAENLRQLPLRLHVMHFDLLCPRPPPPPTSAAASSSNGSSSCSDYSTSALFLPSSKREPLPSVCLFLCWSSASTFLKTRSPLSTPLQFSQAQLSASQFSCPPKNSPSPSMTSATSTLSQHLP